MLRELSQVKWRTRYRMRAENCLRSCRDVPEVVLTYSAEETMAWGRGFAKKLQAPVLVLLSGELGSGKTTLTKGIVAGLGVATEDEVTSPDLHTAP